MSLIIIQSQGRRNRGNAHIIDLRFSNLNTVIQCTSLFCYKFSNVYITLCNVLGRSAEQGIMWMGKTTHPCLKLLATPLVQS